MWVFNMPDSVTIYMSTSTLENAVQILLNAGCIERHEDVEKFAEVHLEHIFDITVKQEE